MIEFYNNSRPYIIQKNHRELMSKIQKIYKSETIEEAKKIIENFVKMIKRENLSQEEINSLEEAVAFKNISNLEELDNYRRKLEHFREYIGYTDDYTFYDDYYTEKMSALEHKSNVLENGGIETALEVKKPNKFVSWFRAIKNFVTGEKIHN